MADIHTVSRKKGPDAIYIRQRYSADNGGVKQKQIRCADMTEAKELLPLVQEAEDKGILYVDTRPVSYPGNSVLSSHYGAVSTRYADITIGELLPMYLEDAAGRGRFSPNVLTSKKGIVSNHIIPYIGNVPIRNIDTMFIQDFFDDLLNHRAAQGNHTSQAPLNSARTVAEVRKILSPAFGYAITRLRAIKTNPITPDIIMPKYETKPRDQWDYDELVEALSSETDPQLKAVIALIPSETVRNCELLGLCWDCVHLPDHITEADPAYIYIKRELLRVKLTDLEATKVTPFRVFPNVSKKASSRMCLLEKTKTSRTRRIVYLPEKAAEILREHRQRQVEMKAFYGESYQDYNLVFALEDRFPGRPISNETINRYFRKFKEAHGLRDVTLYSLRGSGVTQKLRIPGISPKVVQTDMGGDTEAVMMKHYATAEDRDRRRLAAEINKAFFGNGKDETSQENQDDTD
ncbi:MAG: site-specific integrase [Lachnospiraceae bacterium]|nr:site-specific integrase [Lachnospiraceae bacterium]